VTSPGQAAGAAQQAAGTTATTAKDEVAATAQTATSAAADVAGTAKEQVGQVAGEAVDQVRQLADQARGQASEQAGNATQKLSETVRSLAGEVRDMSQGKGDSSGTVAGLAQQLADKGEQLAEYLSQQGPGGLVQELRGFAARKPGTFLLGALAAGLATGRVVKGASSSGASGATTTSPQPQVGRLPLAPSTPPAATPAFAPDPYPATTALAGTDSGVLDDGAQGIGPVSGDQRLIDEGAGTPSYERGTGLR
jgi:uncharacterized protein YjbJ (UPF0337 family)